MQDPSSIFCNQLRSFCDHLQSMCSNLKASMQQRPIPLGSSLNSSLEGLNRRLTSTNQQVEALESMTIDTISFQELLGHCNQIYKQNESALSVLEDRLKEYGYEPGEIDSGDEPSPSDISSPRTDGVTELESFLNHSLAIQTTSQAFNYRTGAGSASFLSSTPVSVRECSRNVRQDDFMFEDSVSLQDLGLSDACLATLAGEASKGSYSSTYPSPLSTLPSHRSKCQDKELPSDHLNFPDFPSKLHPSSNTCQKSSEDLQEEETSREGTAGDYILPVSKAEYDNTPSWLRDLASWEDLDDGIGKINSLLSKRTAQNSGKGAELFGQDDLEPLGLGPKARAYLLLLVRMNRLTLEHQAGVTMYRLGSK